MNSETKLLLVSYYAPPANVGAGVAMYHLISKLPVGSYAILTEERDVCDSSQNVGEYLNAPYYFYSSKSINPLKPLNTITAEKNIEKINFSNRFLIFLKKNNFLRRLGQFIVIARHVYRIVMSGRVAIKNENPTMIVAYSDSGPVLIASYLLSIFYNIPLSLFFYDLYKGNNLTPVLNFYASIFEPLILYRARHVFVMNDLLKDVYISRGKNNVSVIYNSLPEHKHLDALKKVSKVKSIAYLGSVYWAQVSALHDLISATALLKPQPLLNLYTPYTPEYLNSLNIFESENIKFKNCSPENAIIELEKHDLTFLGLSKTTPYQMLINTSSPVRLCDYLNAKVPMLVHAPAESFVVKHALTHDFAFVSTSSSVKDLASILQEALTSKDREVKVDNANRVAKMYHDPKKSADLFFRIVNT